MSKAAVTRRKAPDFGFEHVPKYWFGNDPFKTRFFDAMSTGFPEGEKYFIESVRAYRDEVMDPALAKDVGDFTYQEAQHSLAHRLFNDRLREQGIDVDRYDRAIRAWVGFEMNHMSREWNVANTAAAEHLTAIMSHVWLQDDVHRDSDPRMRALYHWHSIEEIEHKAVAFDVMQKVAGVGYLLRVAALVYETAAFPLGVLVIVDDMLRADGFSRRERARMWARGLRWLLGKGGLLRSLLPAYLAYYRPDFHPWQEGQMASYREWKKIYEATGDALQAGSPKNKPSMAA